MMVQGKLNDKE